MENTEAVGVAFASIARENQTKSKINPVEKYGTHKNMQRLRRKPRC
jgi:hypothetical protein